MRRYYDLDSNLPGSLRVGLEALRVAAAERGLSEQTVAEVFEAAFNPSFKFNARQVNGYVEVFDVATSVNGWAWADACLAGAERRTGWFMAVRKQCVRYAAKHFPALHKHDRAAVVEDLLYLELSGAWIRSTAFDADLPVWMVPGIVFERLQWRLLDAKAKLVDRRREVTVRRGARDITYAIQSWDRLVEALGEREPNVRPIWAGPDVDADIESAVWGAARLSLTGRAAAMIQGARSGPVRAKVTLTVEAAKWVLAQGSADSFTRQGVRVMGSAEEFRQAYAQDSLLACFRGLRAAAPTTWGCYPGAAVPTREVIEQAATAAKARADVNAAWFACREARRVDVAKGDRILHGVRRLVESLLEQAARDTDL